MNAPVPPLRTRGMFAHICHAVAVKANIQLWNTKRWERLKFTVTGGEQRQEILTNVCSCLSFRIYLTPNSRGVPYRIMCSSLGGWELLTFRLLCPEIDDILMVTV